MSAEIGNACDYVGITIYTAWGHPLPRHYATKCCRRATPIRPTKRQLISPPLQKYPYIYSTRSTTDKFSRQTELTTPLNVQAAQAGLEFGLPESCRISACGWHTQSWRISEVFLRRAHALVAPETPSHIPFLYLLGASAQHYGTAVAESTPNEGNLQLKQAV